MSEIILIENMMKKKESKNCKTALIFSGDNTIFGLNILMLWHLQAERELYFSIAENVTYEHIAIQTRDLDHVIVMPHVKIDERNIVSCNSLWMQISTLFSLQDGKIDEVWFDDQKPKCKWLVNFVGWCLNMKVDFPVHNLPLEQKENFLTKTAMIPKEEIEQVIRGVSKKQYEEIEQNIRNCMLSGEDPI